MNRITMNRIFITHPPLAPLPRQNRHSALSSPSKSTSLENLPSRQSYLRHTMVCAHKKHTRNPGHDLAFFWILSPWFCHKAANRESQIWNIQVESVRLAHASTETHKLEVLLIIKAATRENQKWRQDNEVKNPMDAMVMKALTALRAGKLLYRRLITWRHPVVLMMVLLGRL